MLNMAIDRGIRSKFPRWPVGYFSTKFPSRDFIHETKLIVVILNMHGLLCMANSQVQQIWNNGSHNFIRL